MEENEVKKIKQLFRKGVALALAAVTTLSVLPAATVSTASQRATITFAYCYDGNGNTIRYQQTASHNGITFSHAGEARTRIYADGDNAYCIEPGISLHTGNTLEKDASVVWNNLGKAKQDAVNLALLYGAQGSMGSMSGTEDEKVLATQMVIWEIVTGCRNASAPYAQTDAKFYNSLCVGGVNSGIAAIAAEKKIREMEEEAVRQALSEQAQGPGIEIEKLRLNFDTLLKTLSVSVSDLARFLSYDPSYLSRIRKGQRKLSDPQKFTADAFLKLDAKTEGTRRSILSSLPLYTADDELVFQVLRDNRVSEKNQIRIMEHIAFQRELTEEILSHDSIFEAYPNFSKDEFAQYPMTLSLAGAFYEEDIVYTYEQYREHLEMMKRFSQMHKNYHIEENKSPAFRHIQILIHEGSWVIVSKEKTPAIHFVIRHPKMREAMENITMPIVEGEEYK